MALVQRPRANSVTEAETSYSFRDKVGCTIKPSLATFWSRPAASHCEDKCNTRSPHGLPTLQQVDLNTGLGTGRTPVSEFLTRCSVYALAASCCKRSGEVVRQNDREAVSGRCDR